MNPIKIEKRNVPRPNTLMEWGTRYVNEFVRLGVPKEEAFYYWVQSILWPNGEDLLSLTIDIPEEAAEFDLPYFKKINNDT